MANGTTRMELAKGSYNNYFGKGATKTKVGKKDLKTDSNVPTKKKKTNSQAKVAY